jgi:NADPH:quinone reductase-like Zn-dependent oxidoreductase
VVGTVVDVGDGVTAYDVGDRVGGVVFAGAYAELALADQRRGRLWDMLADGRLRPKHVEFPLDQVQSAVELVMARANLGRVVLRMT